MPEPNGTPTIGEVTRRLGDLQSAVSEGFSRVHTRLDALPASFVNRDVYAVERQNMVDTQRNDVKDITDQLKRFRTFGYFIASTMAMMVASGAGYLISHLH